MVLLTVGITICARSDMSKINYMLLSLFDSNCNCALFSNIEQCKELKTNYLNGYYCIDNIRLIKPSNSVEIIIVQDGKNKLLSTYIKTLIKFYHKYLNRVSFKFIVHDEFQSVSMSRNTIIKQAKGKFVKLCDDDDLSININELLLIIKQHIDYDYIECCMSNLTKPVNQPIYTGWFPTNVIVNTNWIKTNNLYFVSKIVGEDSIWRFDMYWMFKIHPETKVKVNPKSIYLIYRKSYKTTSFDDESRFNDMMSRTFEHEKELFNKIPMNPFMFLIISNMVYSKNHMIDVSSYIINHSEDFAFSSLINEIQQYKSEIFKNNISPFQSKRQLEPIRNLYDKYYTSYTEDSFNQFRLLYLNLQNALTQPTSTCKILSDKFTQSFMDGYYLRTYIHMNKRKGTNLLVPGNPFHKYHSVIEDINNPITHWMTKLERVEFETTNNIYDDVIFTNSKYAFVPYSIFVWLMFNINDKTKQEEITTPVIKQTQHITTKNEPIKNILKYIISLMFIMLLFVNI